MSGLGCHIGHISFSGLGYADDVSTITPSLTALQSLVHICEAFSVDDNVLFNTKKTICMCIGRNIRLPTRKIALNGTPLPWSK